MMMCNAWNRREQVRLPKVADEQDEGGRRESDGEWNDHLPAELHSRSKAERALTLCSGLCCLCLPN